MKLGTTLRTIKTDMRQNEDWPDFVRDIKQGLEPGGGQHMCHWRGQSDCQITAQSFDGFYHSF